MLVRGGRGARSWGVRALPARCLAHRPPLTPSAPTLCTRPDRYMPCTAEFFLAHSRLLRLPTAMLCQPVPPAEQLQEQQQHSPRAGGGGSTSSGSSGEVEELVPLGSVTAASLLEAQGALPAGRILRLDIEAAARGGAPVVRGFMGGDGGGVCRVGEMAGVRAPAWLQHASRRA